MRGTVSILAALLVTCGGNDRTDDDTTIDASPDGGDEECRIPWQCASSTDCSGRECVRFPDEPGGLRYCATIFTEASGCTTSSDVCCSSADCTAGVNGGCFNSNWGYCGVSPPYAWHNACVYDECVDDSDCTSGDICKPAALGQWGRSECIPAICRTSADCNSYPCGYCAPMLPACCAHRVELFCMYPGNCGYDDLACEYPEECYGTYDGATECQLPVCPG